MRVRVCVYLAPKAPVVVFSLDIVENLLPAELCCGCTFVFIFSINIADPSDL